jgi:uncharacterized membrane protein
LASGGLAVQAQSAGKLKGKVLDNRGTPIIHTRIVIRNTQKRSMVAANDYTGEYEVDLPPGTYTVKIEARPGFGKFIRKRVVVRAGKITILDIVPESRIYAG